VSTPVRFDIDLGDAFDFTVLLQDEAGEPIDLTGWNLDIFDPATELEGEVTATFNDAAAGSIAVHVNAVRTLKPYLGYGFRVGYTPPSGADNGEAFPQFLLVPR